MIWLSKRLGGGGPEDINKLLSMLVPEYDQLLIVETKASRAEEKRMEEIKSKKI